MPTSTSVPYSESEKSDLSDYPIFPICSKFVFEQQKHSSLSRDAAIAMQKANKQAADAAVAALNGMATGADIIRACPFIDAGSAAKIAANKPVTWYFLHLILMQRQISKLLAWQKKLLGVNPPPAAP